MLTSPGLPLGMTGFTFTSSFTMLFARLVAGLLPVIVFKRELSSGDDDPLFAALSVICACCGLRWMVSR
jgi:hypothetical protein